MDERLRQLMTLGREHYRAGEYDKAEPILQEVLKEHRGFADIFNMLGVMHHAGGRFGEAQSAFEEALRINPTYTEAALNLAVNYNDQGKYAQAREVYTRALARTRAAARQLDPFARGKIANMHADVGAAYAGSGLYPEAVREYEKALSMAPGFIDIRTRLAAVYRDMGDYAAARKQLEQVKTESPGYLPARLALGVTLFSLGERDAAVKEWEAVLQAEPDNKAARAYVQMTRDEAHGPRAGASVNPTMAGSASTVPLNEPTLEEIFRSLDDDDE